VGGGKLDLTVGPKQTIGRPVENVVIEIAMPSQVLNVTLMNNQGKHSFDPVTKVLLWEIGRIDPSKLPNIRGTVRIPPWICSVQSNYLLNISLVTNKQLLL